jgi:hypothetical protein
MILVGCQGPSGGPQDKPIATKAEKETSVSAKVIRENGNARIDGVPTLGWGRGIGCTYAGAVQAALAVTEHPVDYADIMGFSGLAFRVRWWNSSTDPGNRGWCPSTPVGEFPEEVEATQRCVGWRFRIVSRMDKEKDPHMEDQVAAIVASIDAGRPVVAYPTTENLDMGVIYGYQDRGKSWVLRDYFAKDGTTLVPAEKLGPMIFILDKFAPPIPRRQAIREALELAVKHWTRGRGPTEKHNYLYGRAALEQWSRDIALADDPNAKMTEKELGNLLFLGWWNYSQWADAREAAVRFLDRSGGDVGGPAGEAIRRAARQYEQEAALLSSVTGNKDAFLGPWSGKKPADWTGEVRKREREILAEAARIESAAVEEIRKALAGM